MQSGLCEAITNELSFMAIYQLDEITKYAMDIGWLVSITPIVWNGAVWDSLLPQDREAIESMNLEFCTQVAQNFDAFKKIAIEDAKNEYGVEVYTLTAAEREAFKEVMTTAGQDYIDSLKDSDVELTHINLNDNTLEGLRCKKLPAFSVQYHPEASPGPHDSAYLFTEFIKLMTGNITK